MRALPVSVTRKPSLATGIRAATRSRRSMSALRNAHVSRSRHASLSNAISGRHAQPSACSRTRRPGPQLPPASRMSSLPGPMSGADSRASTGNEHLPCRHLG